MSRERRLIPGDIVPLSTLMADGHARSHRESLTKKRIGAGILVLLTLAFTWSVAKPGFNTLGFGLAVAMPDHSSSSSAEAPAQGGYDPYKVDISHEEPVALPKVETPEVTTPVEKEETVSRPILMKSVSFVHIVRETPSHKAPSVETPVVNPIVEPAPVEPQEQAPTVPDTTPEVPPTTPETPIEEEPPVQVG